MTEPAESTRDKRRAGFIITAYPVAVLALSLIINLVLGFRPLEVALPDRAGAMALAGAVALLIVNHTWLMTSTELTRLRFGLHATPEEWAAAGAKPQDASQLGLQELQRHHNAHRNATENTVCFALLAPLFLLASPTALALPVWLLGFALGRLGHTYGYLAGNDTLRGLFMTVSLCAMYGMAGYLVMGALL